MGSNMKIIRDGGREGDKNDGHQNTDEHHGRLAQVKNPLLVGTGLGGKAKKSSFHSKHIDDVDDPNERVELCDLAILGLVKHVDSVQRYEQEIKDPRQDAPQAIKGGFTG
jgi:hypothetical protein